MTPPDASTGPTRPGPVAMAATLAVLTWTLLLTLARALRVPNDFAEAHWLIDYRFGLTRRGLVGSIVSVAFGLFDAPVTENAICALSDVAIAVFGILLVAVAYRLVRRINPPSLGLRFALLFLSSPFIVMSGHLFGYLDNIFIALSVVSIARVLRGRTWSGAWLLAGAVFVHESTLLVGLPAFVLASCSVSGDAPSRRSLSHPALALPLAAALLITLAPLFTEPDALRSSLTDRLASHSFIASDRAAEVPDWHTRSAFEHIASLRSLFLRLSHPLYYVLVLPTVVTSIFLLRSARSDLRVLRWMPLLLAAIPQVMHLVAWDTTRIWTYGILCAVLAVWILSETRILVTAPRVQWAALTGIAVHLLVPVPLMDDEVEAFDLLTRLLGYGPMILVALRPQLLVPGIAQAPHGTRS